MFFSARPELGGPPAAVGERLEISQEMRPARLTLRGVDPAIAAVAIADEDALEVLAEQQLGDTRGAAVGQVVDGDLIRAGQPRPAPPAGPAPAGFVGVHDRLLTHRAGQLVIRVGERVAGALADRLDRGGRHRTCEVVDDELRDLLAGHVRGQADDRRAQVGAERPLRCSRAKITQRDLAAARAPAPQPLMLGDQAHDRGQLPHLMGHRLSDRLSIAEILATAIAARGPMLDRRVRISDHLTMTAPCPGWPPGLRPERSRAGRLGVCGGSLDGGRELLVEFCPNRRSRSSHRPSTTASCSRNDAFSALNSPISSRPATLHNYAPGPEMPAQTPRPPEYVRQRGHRDPWHQSRMRS